jgi:hypothetical protein
MRINTEQQKTLIGAVNTIQLNSDCTYTQVTISGRNTGNVTATIRPLLENNDIDDFQDDDFEGITDGVINLSLNPKKRTFTIEMKRATALRLEDDGAGEYKLYISQWGRANH